MKVHTHTLHVRSTVYNTYSYIRVNCLRGRNTWYAFLLTVHYSFLLTHIMKVQILYMPATCVDSSLHSWASLLKPCILQAISCLNSSTRPSPSPKHGKMPIRVTTLAFDHFFCTITANVPCSSLSSKNSGKGDDCSLGVPRPSTVSFSSLLIYT